MFWILLWFFHDVGKNGISKKNPTLVLCRFLAFKFKLLAYHNLFGRIMKKIFRTFTLHFSMSFLNLCFNSINSIRKYQSYFWWRSRWQNFQPMKWPFYILVYLPNNSRYRDAQLSPSSAGGVMAFAIPCYFYPIQSSLVCWAEEF